MSTDRWATAFVTGAAGAGESFESVVLPHLDAGHRLARWLLKDEHDAEDAVQEASLRAFRHFRTFNGGDGRAWFLRIVRNTCYGWRRSSQAATDPFDEERHSRDGSQANPETLLLRNHDAASITRALNRLPGHVHDLLLMRAVEGLSYRELADVLEVPVGTVMSRLSRAREALRGALEGEFATPDVSSRPGSRELEADAVLA